MNHKIAVCFYGQPRTWQYCAPWIKAAFNPELGTNGAFRKFDTTNGINDSFMLARKTNLDVDYFFNAKDYNTFSNTSNKETERVSAEELAAIVAEYSPKGHSFTTLEQDDATVGRPGDWHFSRMISSMCAVNELKKAYEASENFVYDVVIMHRFDTLAGPRPESYLPTLLAKGVEPMSVYTTSSENFRMYRELWRTGFDDMVFAGDSLGIDMLTSYFYRKFENTVESNLNDIDYRLGPNVLISEAVHESAMVRRHIPGELAIVRSEADLNRHVLTSFKYHHEFWHTNHKSHGFK